MKKGVIVLFLFICLSSVVIAEEIVDVFSLEPGLSYTLDGNEDDTSFFYFGYSNIEDCFIILEEDLLYTPFYRDIYEFREENPGEPLPEILLQAIKDKMLFELQLAGSSYNDAMQIVDNFDPDNYIPIGSDLEPSEFNNLLIEISSGKYVLVFTNVIEFNKNNGRVTETTYKRKELSLPIIFEPGVVYSFTEVGAGTDSGRIKENDVFYEEIEQLFMDHSGFYVHRITPDDERIVKLDALLTEDPFQLYQ